MLSTLLPCGISLQLLLPILSPHLDSMAFWKVKSQLLCWPSVVRWARYLSKCLALNSCGWWARLSGVVCPASGASSLADTIIYFCFSIRLDLHCMYTLYCQLGPGLFSSGASWPLVLFKQGKAYISFLDLTCIDSSGEPQSLLIQQSAWFLCKQFCLSYCLSFLDIIMSLFNTDALYVRAI